MLPILLATDDAEAIVHREFVQLDDPAKDSGWAGGQVRQSDELELPLRGL